MSGRGSPTTSGRRQTARNRPPSHSHTKSAYNFLLSNGFAIWRAHSIKSCASGLSVRFLSVGSGSPLRKPIAVVRLGRRNVGFAPDSDRGADIARRRCRANFGLPRRSMNATTSPRLLRHATAGKRIIPEGQQISDALRIAFSAPHPQKHTLPKIAELETLVPVG